MKVGLAFASSIAIDGPASLEICQRAEAAGFESVWGGEHVVLPDSIHSKYPYTEDGKIPAEPDTPIPDPLIWLAFAAAAAPTMRLGTCILIVPQRNPLLLAKELATLDHLSGGRLLLGIGSGWLEEEFDALGVPWARRGARNDDLLAFGADALHVDLELEEESGAVLQCEYGLGRDGGRRFRIDGEAVRRRADLVGRLATVFFNPDSIRLVRGGPERRRQFVDQAMAEIDGAYLAHLTAFQRALKQKNGLLRDLRHGSARGDQVREDLLAWNHEIAHHAAHVGRILDATRVRAERSAHGETDALLAEDARYFLHQSVSTPCLSAIKKAEDRAEFKEAMERIEDESFGICDDCGDDISDKRLEARPVTTLCINCKTKQENYEKAKAG